MSSVMENPFEIKRCRYDSASMDLENDTKCIKQIIASPSHYLLYVTGLHMHWSTCKARSSTSYQLPAASSQQTLGGIHVDYVFAAQPMLPIQHNMISLRGLSLVILVIFSIFVTVKMRCRYERRSNELAGIFFSWRIAAPPRQGYSS